MHENGSKFRVLYQIYQVIIGDIRSIPSSLYYKKPLRTMEPDGLCSVRMTIRTARCSLGKTGFLELARAGHMQLH